MTDKKCILVVEDIEQLRNLIARVLERAGYDVVEASSGAHAVTIMTFRSGPIDLLITDLNLPHGMSGAEVGLEAHTRFPRLPVLYVSGTYPDAGPVEHFLAKPFSGDQLLAKVALMLEEAGGDRRKEREAGE